MLDVSQTQSITIAEIYRITFVSGEIYVLSALSGLAALDGVAVTPAVVSRSAIEFDRDAASQSCTITIRGVQDALHDLLTIPDATIKGEVLWRDLSSGTTEVFFTGWGVPRASLGQIMSLKLRPDRRILDVLVPDKLLQRGCNHMFGDSGCGVNLDDYTLEFECDQVSDDGMTVSHADMALQADAFYTWGRLVCGAEQRLVLSHVGNGIRIQYPFANDIKGQTCQLVAGCDRQQATCSDKFNNGDRFCGMPYAPSINPALYGL